MCSPRIDDGTIAHDGKVDEQTIAALERLKKSGRKLILVTGARAAGPAHHIRPHGPVSTCRDGKRRDDLQPRDEGNAGTGRSRRRRSFTSGFASRGVWPLSVEHVIVATFEPHDKTVFDTIREFGLELQVIFNKGAVMVLPSGVNKATGLVAALRAVGAVAAQRGRRRRRRERPRLPPSCASARRRSPTPCPP